MLQLEKKQYARPDCSSVEVDAGQCVTTTSPLVWSENTPFEEDEEFIM